MPERNRQGNQEYQLSELGELCYKGFLCIIPIAQIVVGAVYQYDCPKQHYIPIFLEVMGAFNLLIIRLSCLPFMKNLNPYSKVVMGLSIPFFLCWFITGNVWIYSIYEPNYNKTITDVDPYCDRTLYLFAFWTTNLNYIQIGLFCCCCCWFCPCQLPFVVLMPGANNP